VLLAADGTASRVIGRAVGCTTGTASKWRVRYAEKRLAGLDETGKRGAAPKYTAETGKRILALLDQPLPQGYARWSGPLLAAALGDVDVQYVWRFLRGQKIDLSGRKSWCESNDPEFVARRPTWSGSTWRHPRTRSSSASTKSRRSRRWRGSKAT
jgi:transposase